MKLTEIKPLKENFNYRQDYIDRYTAMEDFVKEAKQRGSKVETKVGDATIVVYHGTSKDNAENIKLLGRFNKGAWFGPTDKSTKQHTEPKFGKNNTILKIVVDPRDLEVTGAQGEFYAPEELVFDSNVGYWKSINRN
jgi:hypothetical protein